MGEEKATMAGYNSVYQKGGIKKGGFRATMFTFGLMALENMGFVANMASMVIYFLQVMYFDLSGAGNLLTNFMGAAFLLSLVGGFISDTYLNRLHTTLIFGAVELVGLMMVAIQAHEKSLHPIYRGKLNCIEGKSALMLYGSLCLLALGSGGVRGALPALGADQFNRKDPKEEKALATYFNYLLLSTVLGAAVGVTVIVKVSIAHGWFWGFLISLVAAFIGFVILAIGSPFYRIQAPGDSPILRILQVIVVAIKNSKLSVPEKPDELYEINDKESVSAGKEKLSHTSQFSCLDKAAIIRNGLQPEPWTVCTVTQVEEVKILTRMLPILLSTVIMNTCLAQLVTFSIAQGSEMYPHLGFYKVPAPSIPFIPLVFMAILIPMYEFVFVPFARKITNHPQGITQLQRVGVGLVLSAISMAVAGIVEVKRRNEANSIPPNKISLFWLSFQYGIFGIADMFTLVGLLEFFYKEAPIGMRSLSTSFTWLSLSLGYFLSTIFVNVINAVTKKITPSKKGWLHGIELNDNNLNLFYWFLAILSCLNFINYLYWASWYKYKSEEDSDFESKPKVLKGSPFLQEEVTTSTNTQDVHGEKINGTSSFEPKEEGDKEKEEQKMKETPSSEQKEDVKEKEEQLALPAA